MTPLQPKIKTRFYNSLYFQNDRVIKESDFSRISREVNWYVAAAKITPRNVPHVYDVRLTPKKSKLVLELIDGDNCFVTLKERGNIYMANEIVSGIKHILSKYRQYTSSARPSDIQYMYLDKPSSALEYFYKHHGNPFSNRALTINGLPVKPPEQLLPALYEQLLKLFVDRDYCFIHGDLTLSNMILTNQGSLYLIDPRGNFGNTALYGHQLYDIAKLYFSFVDNFDSFNNHNYKLQKLNRSGYVYTIQPNASFGDTSLIFWQYFDIDQQLIRFINATIWLSLAPHLQESEEQTIIAYLHGTLSLNSLYNEIYRHT